MKILKVHQNCYGRQVHENASKYSVHHNMDMEYKNFDEISIASTLFS